ncbi:MAG: 7TM domain-containing protein [Gemmataceae bacterium]
MSRTTLTVMTAIFLALGSASVMLVRYLVLGEDVKMPHGSWKITLLAQGVSHGDARLLTTTPPDFGRQHIANENCQSKELIPKLPDARHPERRYVLWTRRGGPGEGMFRAHYQFKCKIDMHRPTQAMTKGTASLYAPPAPGEYLETHSQSKEDLQTLSERALHLTADAEGTADQALALYHFVEQEIADEPSLDATAVSAIDCLRNGNGDAGGKSRLLIALLRIRSIPARLVTGLILGRNQREEVAHQWVEAWVDEEWLAYCPFNHHFEHVPPNYLVLGFGDTPIVRGRCVSDLRYKFLVERNNLEESLGEVSALRRWLVRSSLYMLPPAEQRLVEFLLLLPLAALIVCLYRNVIGLASFGTFAPALVGLAFRDLHSLPGMLVFVAIVLIGWAMRRVLNAFHLLQVPRTALLLSLVVVVLIAAIIAANFRDLPATRYVALFPMVILTGMVERFWTLETEDSTASSFKTLLGTVIIAASIALFLSLHAVVIVMFRFPETLGLIMACQLLLGRYTGYRLSELYRFRDFLKTPPTRLYLHTES